MITRQPTRRPPDLGSVRLEALRRLNAFGVPCDQLHPSALIVGELVHAMGRLTQAMHNNGRMSCHAPTGAAALQRLIHHQFRVVVLATQLPDIAVIPWCRLIRERFPGPGDLGIVLVNPEFTQPQVLETIELGIDLLNEGHRVTPRLIAARVEAILRAIGLAG